MEIPQTQQLASTQVHTIYIYTYCILLIGLGVDRLSCVHPPPLHLLPNPLREGEGQFKSIHTDPALKDSRGVYHSFKQRERVCVLSILTVPYDLYMIEIYTYNHTCIYPPLPNISHLMVVFPGL